MKTFSEIANVLTREERKKYTSSDVFYIYKKALRKMRANLTRRGINIGDLLQEKK